MVLLESQLEGSGPEGKKRGCPPLVHQWSPLPRFPLAGLAYLMVKKERRTSVDQTEYKISPGKIGPDASTGLQAVTVAALQSNYGWKIRLGVKNH